MPYDPERHHRRSIRLNGYDYRRPGAYFVTLCVHDRACVFGEVVDGVMRHSPVGHIAHACWMAIPDHHANVVLDAFVVMPNHVHGIIVITEPAPPPRGDERHRRDTIYRVPTSASPPPLASPGARGGNPPHRINRHSIRPNNSAGRRRDRYPPSCAPIRPPLPGNAGNKDGHSNGNPGSTTASFGPSTKWTVSVSTSSITRSGGKVIVFSQNSAERRC